MKRRNNIHVMLVAVWTAISAPAIMAASTNDVTGLDLLNQAYRKVVDAELLRADNRTSDAVQAFRQALELFGRVQIEYPGWQTKAVSLRISECSSAIEAIETSRMDKSAPTNAPDAKEETRLSQLLDELRAFRNALSPEIGATATPAGEAKNEEQQRTREDLDRALRANQELLRRIDKLTLQLAKGPHDSTSKPSSASRAVTGAIWNEARRLLQDGNAPEASTLVQEARKIFPDDANLTTLHGIVACRAGRFDEAIRILQPVTGRSSSNTTALITLGSACLAMGRMGDARVAMEQAVKSNPSSPEAHFNLAQILVNIKPADVAGAQAHYKQAIDLGMSPDPDFENALNTASIISRMKKKKK